MRAALTAVALAIAGTRLAVFVWSTAQPNRRLWPPRHFRAVSATIGWGGTFAFFAAVAALGLLGWGEAAVPRWLRYRAGPVLILTENAVVWSAVIGFGADQTMGAEGRLKTEGL